MAWQPTVYRAIKRGFQLEAFPAQHNGYQWGFGSRVMEIDWGIMNVESRVMLRIRCFSC